VRLKPAVESASVSERQNWQTRTHFVLPEVAFHCGVGLRRIVHNEITPNRSSATRQAGAAERLKRRIPEARLHRFVCT
jgi:hypothetical protein